MNLPISNRLLTCCGFINPGDRVADIGCDHGYLGIQLLRTGVAQFVIAADVNKMPLEAAMKNAEKYGVRDKMSFYLSDGVRDIPRDFDVLVCAGMGADTIVSILSAAPWLQSDTYRLVLQCQSKTPFLRRYLSETGWRICKERVLRDGRFLYTVMEAVHAPGHLLSPGQWYFPPALLENPDKELPEYYRRVIDGLRLAAQHQSDPIFSAALHELDNDNALKWLKEELHDNGC